MPRASTFGVALAVLAVGTSGCSFLFVRKPTPEGARAPGACEGRGIAAGTDAMLSLLAAYRLAEPSSSLLAVKPIGSSGDVMLRQSPWLVRNGEVVWLPALLLTVSSMTYGIARTSECSELRAASAPELAPARPTVPRSAAPSIRSPPLAPAAGVPQAAPAPPAPPPPPVPQQTDDESTSPP